MDKKEKEEKPIFRSKMKASVLKGVTEIISPLVKEAKFSITPKGILINAVDPAHVALARVEIKDSSFEEYHADEIDLGVDIHKLNGALKLAESDGTISLEYDEHENKLVLIIGNLVRKMGLIDVRGMPDTKMPKLDLPAKVVIVAGEMSKAVRASEMVSDHIVLTADKDKFTLYAEGDGIDTVDLTLPKDSLVELKSADKYRSLFSLDYLSSMIKPAKAEDQITLMLGNDKPLHIEFDFADKKGHVTYMLVPRIGSE